MDLFKIIQNLREEKRRIDRAIAAIEELTAGKGPLVLGSDEAAAPIKKRRGRPPKNPPANHAIS